MIERTLPVSTHGRYLVCVPDAPGPWPLLVGFHGYAETAAVALDRLEAIDRTGAWLRVGIQALHRFYRGRSRDVIASWMTSEDRVLAIADNVRYIASVVDAVAHEWQTTERIVFSGFSQGVAMAFRAAAAAARPVAAVIALGGDVPPEIDAASLARIPRVLLGRGSTDQWYTEAKIATDAGRLLQAGVALEQCAFDGGHEWTPAFTQAAAELLRRLQR